MDLDLSSDEQDLQALAREFATREVAGHAEQWWLDGEVPPEVLKKMAEMDLMGLLVPPEYGGIGASTVGMVAAIAEVGRVDQSVAATWQAHLTIGSVPLLLFGTEEQKRRWLVPLATGEYLGAFGLTEPEAGSDASAIKTTAQADGDGWIITGVKTFITNAASDRSGGVTLLVRLKGDAYSDDEPRFANFFVPRETEGYGVGKRLRGIGWRSVDSRELIFDNCRVPKDHLIGETDRGLSQFLSALEVGRITIAALSMSLTEAVLEMALDYSKNRRQFGRPISKHQAIQMKIADIASHLEAVRWLVFRAAWLRDQGRPFRKEAAMAKLRASSLAMKAASEAVQIHGGYGFMAETPVARFFLDAKVLEIGEGTNEIQHLVIARELGC